MSSGYRESSSRLSEIHSSPLSAGIFVVSGTETELYRKFEVRQSFWSQIPKLESDGAVVGGVEECGEACVSNKKCTAFLYDTECTLAKVYVGVGVRYVGFVAWSGVLVDPTALTQVVVCLLS